jgi:hypothetical protein
MRIHSTALNLIKDVFHEVPRVQSAISCRPNIIFFNQVDDDRVRIPGCAYLLPVSSLRHSADAGREAQILPQVLRPALIVSLYGI